MAALIRLAGCKKFVEIGTLTGLSALWILRAMGEGGKLWTFEKDPAHAESAAKTLHDYTQIHSSQAAQVVVGDAIATLPSINSNGPFDGVFIDGNKAAYGSYLDWAEKNVRKGGLIIGDNIFLGGTVYSSEKGKFSDKQITVMQNFNQRLADPTKYLSAVAPTAEGFFIAIKLD